MICRESDPPYRRCPAYAACMALMRQSYQEHRWIPFVLPSCNGIPGEDPVGILVRYWVVSQPAGTEFVSSALFAELHDGSRTYKHFVRMARAALARLRAEGVIVVAVPGRGSRPPVYRICGKDESVQ